ncbi:MAG: LytTR family transcriptional regulator DNA-binding domain-containing protein [Marinosulfonomonas sp.]|nr:LytTR family transcriptional regulator DNA-binding domain-containing protein [Marinosulfonomonas sp.]
MSAQYVSMKKYLIMLAGKLFTLPAVSAAFLASVLLTVAGPFGTGQDITLVPRAIYWTSVVGLAGLVISLLKAIIDDRYSALNFWRYSLVLSGAFAVVYTPILFGLAHWMTGHLRENITPFVELFFIAFATTMAFCHFKYFVSGDDRAVFPRLFRRFVDSEAGQVFRVSVRDHYVDVFTDRGTETLLLRFRDAIDELDDIPGLQVHRSHWVAEDAVSGLEREAGRLFVRLSDDSRVPVSRGYRAEVEDRFT